MSDLIVQASGGAYGVDFLSDLSGLDEVVGDPSALFIVDAKVAELYRPVTSRMDGRRTIVIEALEQSKELSAVTDVIHKLVAMGVRRDNRLVAVGGGVIQDIACFIASVLLRGIPWAFHPTTLLAQADSCIGSKSSINLGRAKNIVGTFYPPTEVVVSSEFLRTLEVRDIHSGVGEMIKVHVIAGIDAFDGFASCFDDIFGDDALMMRYVRASLEIKKKYIEIDEFDRGVRNIFNYGHSFGHAIESVTDFAIPHGIAISIGMSVANHVATARGILPRGHYERMQPVLKRNYADYADAAIEPAPVVEAMTKDKKNTRDNFVLILPVGSTCVVEPVIVPLDDALRRQIGDALAAALS